MCRLKTDLLACLTRVRALTQSYWKREIRLHGVGGRTVHIKLIKYDLSRVLALSPDIVILELGTNDLTYASPRGR